MSEDALLTSILTQKTFLSCFQRSSKNEFLLPSLPMKKLWDFSRVRLLLFRHNHILIRVSGWLELVISTGRPHLFTAPKIQMGKHSSCYFWFQSRPQGLNIKTIHLLWTPTKIRPARGPVSSKYKLNLGCTAGMPLTNPSDQLTTDFPCSFCWWKFCQIPK